MVNRIVAIVILVPVALVLIALVVANRKPAGFTLDPFHPGNPALTVELPLFVWLFAALVLGMVIGSAATWLRQGRYRKAARESNRKLNAMRNEKRAESGKHPPALPASGN